MAVTRGTLRLARQLRRDVGTEADDAVRALTADWVRAWDRLAPIWTSAAAELVTAAVALGRWPRPGEILRMGEVDRAMRGSIAALDKLAERTETLTRDAADRVIQLDTEREAGVIASQVPAAEEPGLAALLANRPGRASVEALREAWSLREQARDEVRVAVVTRVRTDAVNVVTRRTGQQIHATTLPLSPQAQDAMRRELIAGIDVGRNPRDAGRRMVTAVQGQFNGGLTRATNIARTEILDAYRATSQQIHQANADLVPGWQWLATFDLRTCPSCLSLHGTTYPVTDPGPQDHQQGRCARLPLLAPWSQLGIDAPEPPSAVPSSQAWFDGLPEAAQLRIMGPGRLGLYRAGRVGWGDLATLRPSGRWRPSWTPTPLRDLRARVTRGLPPTAGRAVGQAPPPAPTYTARVAAAAKEQAVLDASRAALDVRARPGMVTMTRPQRAALRDYESSFYYAVNGQLRRGQVEPLVQRRVDRIDEVMSASRLSSDVATYRGVTNPRVLFGDRLDGDLTGMEWLERSYVSTSASARVAADFTYGDGLIMNVLVPRGVGAVRISGYGVGQQAELLLERGLGMRVVADHGIVGGVRRIDVEVFRP